MGRNPQCGGCRGGRAQGLWLGVLQNSDSGGLEPAGPLCLAGSSREKRQPHVSCKQGHCVLCGSREHGFFREEPFPRHTKSRS